ncbi:YbfB/YjiJ family MFS transporter [Brevibacillus massiliensis]|uniref:YbfB/YjiJ family MFS transporter n=1 Tax=Brevibacillus massiliensis TaxID=1118054 RepID=UPI0013763481
MEGLSTSTPGWLASANWIGYFVGALLVLLISKWPSCRALAFLFVHLYTMTGR